MLKKMPVKNSYYDLNRQKSFRLNICLAANVKFSAVPRVKSKPDGFCEIKSTHRRSVLFSAKE